MKMPKSPCGAFGILASDAAAPAQSWRAAKVSQLATLPLCIPCLNHRTRCAEEPCVKLSGTA